MSSLIQGNTVLVVGPDTMILATELLILGQDWCFYWYREADRTGSSRERVNLILFSRTEVSSHFASRYV